MKRKYFKLSLILSWVIINFIIPRNILLAQLPCLTDAWDANNKKNYKAVIEACNRCINDFSIDADSAQAELLRNKVLPPPFGKVSDADKKRILERGVLNDVGTAYFLKGQSAEYLFRQGGRKSTSYKRMATEAYMAACRYPYARTWDTQGFFWQPAKEAFNHLNKLR